VDRAALEQALAEGEQCRVRIAQLTQELAEQKEAMTSFEQQSAEAIAQLQGDVRIFSYGRTLQVYLAVY
jgi:hypothetical protein